MQDSKFNVVNLISCRRQSTCRYLGEILARAAFGALVGAGLCAVLAITKLYD